MYVLVDNDAAEDTDTSVCFNPMAAVMVVAAGQGAAVSGAIGGIR